MIETFLTLATSLNENRPVAYCRLVETRGSTPQKAGATMLVYEDGSQAGTLGGGCVEAEVKRNAIRIMKSGKAELTTFSLDHDYGWDDGLICGGRMTVHTEPILPASDDSYRQYFETLAALATTGGFTEAIVFDANQSGLKSPASVLFDANDNPTSSLHIEIDAANQIRDRLRPIQDRPRPYAADGIAFLPIAERCRLLIVGGGHIGQAVASLAADLDFEVWVTDDRESYISDDRFPRAERRIAGSCAQILPELPVNSNTYCLIVTRGHNHDQEALFHLANRGARYVGMIGSKRKIRMIFDDLRQDGIPAEVLESVHAPVGIDIGSQTVSEIAISIAAEIIAHRNCEGRVPGRFDLSSHA